MTARYQAHPRRGPQWAPEPRPSRLREVLYGLAWLVIIVASGVRW